MQNQHLTHSLASPDVCRFLPHASHDVCHSSSRLTHGNQGDRSQFRSTRLTASTPLRHPGKSPSLGGNTKHLWRGGGKEKAVEEEGEIQGEIKGEGRRGS
ncbi:hypothetical protein Pcinc_036815 [Petrolisthes cinctipes]|uniref:Uncharacterized protein n=1 Tax=Petrolisthes cinctipes TaxID=88211 RepID=A0AAE1EPD4_PETCI|nr:hypothetical protein Pcinc_036815 [Petrolisthes cinctipes]